MLNSRESAEFESGRRPFAFWRQQENLSPENRQLHLTSTVRFFAGTNENSFRERVLSEAAGF
jgi:hypothetical protein